MNGLRIDLPFPAMIFFILHYSAITSPSLPNPTLLCPIQHRPMTVLLLSLLTHNVSYATLLTTLSLPISSPTIHDRIYVPIVFSYDNPTFTYNI